MSTKMFYSLLAVVALIATAGIYGLANGWHFTESRTVKLEPEQGEIALKRELTKGEFIHGDVPRLKSDIQRQQPVISSGGLVGSRGKRIGRSPKINLDSSKYTQSLKEAFDNPGKYPERLGLTHAAKPFDQESFDKDPEKYLTTVEPSRIHQNLEVGPGVKALKRRSPLFQKMIQGETVTLQVESLPLAPVTFHSYDLGHFSNQLTTVTVQSDKDGIARTSFTASKGTYGQLDILAASPLNSRQVNFVIDVALPSL